MTRTYTTITVGDAIRHRVVLTDIADAANKRLRQHQFLKEIVVDGAFTGLFSCGPIPFDSMTVTHNGQAWEIVMEALEHLPTKRRGTP